LQMFKYQVVGFLQWGYNYYHNQYSLDCINPYLDPSGDFFVPAGDMYSVYPAQDGTALESMRLPVFYDALQDIRACELCASLYGRETVLRALEEITGEIRFDKCIPAAMLLRVRDKINTMIKEVK